MKSADVICASAAMNIPAELAQTIGSGSEELVPVVGQNLLARRPTSSVHDGIDY